MAFKSISPAEIPIGEFIQLIPKAETHLHIEGACPFELLQRSDPGKYSAPPPFWDPAFRYASFDHFMQLFVEYCGAFFTSAQRYHEAAVVVLRRCREQNCRYVETSFHLPNLLNFKGDGPEVIAALKDAAPAGLELKVFAGMSHDDYRGDTRDLIEAALAWPGLDGLDLHGWEDRPLEPWTADVWRRARRAGKFTKAHAGEFMGPDFVEQVLDQLGVDRIEHGVRAVERAGTIARLKGEGIALDVCPTSNVRLAVAGIPTMAAHPIRALFDAGVVVTVNSDDPFFFNNSLTTEYEALHRDLGFSRAELLKVAENGFKVALLPRHVRAAHLNELGVLAAELAVRPLAVP